MTKFANFTFTATGSNQLLIEKGQILGCKFDVPYILTSNSGLILFVAECHGICSKIFSVPFSLGSFNVTTQR